MSEQQPVAWAVGNPSLVSGRTRAVSVHPQRKWAEASARHNGRSEDDILPLYLSPPSPLTDEERAVIEVCVVHFRSLPASGVLRRLLERLG